MDVFAMFIICAFAVVIFLCVLHLLINCNETGRLIRKVPGPTNYFIFGNALTYMRSPVEIMKMRERHAKLWKGIYRTWIFPYAAVIVYNPEDIEIIMSNMKYGDKSILYKLLKSWLQDGLLTSNGSKWQQRRKILTPTFHFTILRQFSEIIKENGQRLVQNLTQTAGKPIDIVPVLSEFTLNIICETAMGTKLTEASTGEALSYKKALYELGSIVLKRVTTFYYYPDFIYNLSSLKKREDKCLKVLHDFTKKVIQNKKKDIEHDYILNNDEHQYESCGKKTVMLDLLLSAEREGLIDNIGIQEEVDTFMFAGHDTIASGLTFFFMLLANHKTIQDKIVAELKEIFGDSKRPVNMSDLSNMRYLECCIKESLRMYPPAHLISRVLKDHTVLSGYTLPPGTLCHVSIYDLHRRADLFPNPDVFDPDRFLPDNSLGRHPFAYIPFSAGQRNCIGQKFAMMEMKMTTAEVLRAFELVPVTRPQDLQFTADLILRNDKPVYVHFVKRIE